MIFKEELSGNFEQYDSKIKIVWRGSIMWKRLQRANYDRQRRGLTHLMNES